MTRRFLRIPLIVFASTTLMASVSAEPTFAPGDAIDYSKLAFSPKKWAEKKIDTNLFPWKGSEIVFLTPTRELDPVVMSTFISKLDGGWKLYADLTGTRPKQLKHLDGMPTIAAMPQGGLTCGIGCGYIGHTGIEVSGFPSNDYKRLKKNPNAVPHYYFYEMGRNYYTFGARHSLFITGYAVFMRYVCMDSLKCDDSEAGLRKIIEQAEQKFSESEMGFLRGFTTLDGLGEKAPRLKIHPSDQPVIYSSAMLKLWRDYGGNDFLKRFYRQLMSCPPIPAKTKEDAEKQSLNWLVSASAAAHEDLTPLFTSRWRMPVTDAAKRQLSAIKWDSADLDAGKIVQSILAPD